MNEKKNKCQFKGRKFIFAPRFGIIFFVSLSRHEKKSIESVWLRTSTCHQLSIRNLKRQSEEVPIERWRSNLSEVTFLAMLIHKILQKTSRRKIYLQKLSYNNLMIRFTYAETKYLTDNITLCHVRYMLRRRQRRLYTIFF